MKKRKITVVGAGNVGTTVAQRLAELDIADIVLLDIVEGMPQGKALDIMQAGPVLGYNTVVKGTTDYGDTSGSDVVIITSGMPRKPGMSRDDLLKVNYNIVKTVALNIKGTSPDAVVIVVSNPLDVMTYTAFLHTGFPKNRVLGMAGLLDTARFKTFIAMELGVSVNSIDTYVLGGHGDSMVPTLKYTTVAGVPISKLLPKDRLDALVMRTRNGGAEIVNLLKTGSAYYAPSAAAVKMALAIIFDKKEIFTCSVMPEGEFGLKDMYVGLPARLGISGVEKIIEIELDDDEKAALQKSADEVKNMIEVTKGF